MTTQDDLPSLAKLPEVWIRRAGYGDLTPEARPPGTHTFACPICGTRDRRFLPFGMNRRANAQCPGCGSLERHRMLWLYLSEYTDFLQWPRRVLHTAPRSCLESRFRRLHADGYVSTDLYNKTVDVLADLKELPFADASFDFVISSHVLEHIEDDRRAISELSRVVRPGGKAVVMVPLDPEHQTYSGSAGATPADRMAEFGHPFHYRKYGYDLADRLGDAGLAAKLWASTSFLSPAQRRTYRINVNYLMACDREL